MGMSSSQARLLTLTARMHDIEYKAQRIEAQKLQMANESRRAYESYLEALDATKIQYKAINNDGSITFRDATLRTLENGAVSWWEGEASNTPFLLKNGLTNEVYITPEFADEFHIVDGEEVDVGPLDDFLESKGCTKEQDKMKVGGETDYSIIESVSPIVNNVTSGTPAGPWGITGSISPTQITPAGRPTYNLAGTLDAIAEHNDITLNKGGVVYLYRNIKTVDDYSPAAFIGGSGVYLKGIAENIALLSVGAGNGGADALASATNFSNSSSSASQILAKLNEKFTAGTSAPQGLYNLGMALQDIINSDNRSAYSGAYNTIIKWLNGDTPGTIDDLYAGLRAKMSSDYNINLPSNYDMPGNNNITNNSDYSSARVTESYHATSYISKNDLVTYITYNALKDDSLNPDNLSQEQIQQRARTFVDALNNGGVCCIADRLSSSSTRASTITGILNNSISASDINVYAASNYSNPSVPDTDHFSIVEGDVLSVDCASREDILTQIAYDVWSKNNSIAASPQEYLATIQNAWDDNQLASLYSYFGDSTTWNTIMQRIAQGQDISDYLSKYEGLSSDDIHFAGENTLNINTVAGDAPTATSASTEDMQKMLAWSIYNSLSDSEKQSTSPEIIYNNIQNNNGDYLNLNNNQLMSIFEKYGNETKWTQIINKIKNKDSTLFDDTSIVWVNGVYDVTQNPSVVNFVEPTPGTNPKVTIPTLNDILWNIEVALRNLGYDDADIETVKQNVQLTYSTDNDFNNKSLAYINSIICDFLNNYTDPSKASATRELLNNLKMGTSVFVPDTFYSGHDFARSVTSKPHNVQWGKTPVEWVDDPDPDHWHWVNNQIYKDAIDEYYFLKSLEGNKFKVIWDEELLNSSEFVSNWLTLNEGYLLEFDPETRGMVDTNVATNTKLQEVADEKDLKKAEAKYEADMKRIDMKDRRYDTQLAALDTERNAVKLEMETVKTVAKDNVDRTFRLFS